MTSYYGFACFLAGALLMALAHMNRVSSFAVFVAGSALGAAISLAGSAIERRKS